MTTQLVPTNESTTPEEKAEIILDVFADALRLSDEILNLRATNALEAIGEYALPFLEQRVASGSISRGHKARLWQAIDAICINPNSDIDVNAAVVTALFAALQETNRDLNAKAARAIGLMGELIVPELIARALRHRRETSYCKRLLHLAGQLTSSLDLLTQSDLLILARMGNRQVREAAKYVLAKTLPNSPPLAFPESLATQI